MLIPKEPFRNIPEVRMRSREVNWGKNGDFYIESTGDKLFYQHNKDVLIWKTIKHDINQHFTL